MQRTLAAILLFLLSFSAVAVTGEPGTAEAAVEPLSAAYLALLGLILVVVLGFFWKHYMRWDEEEDKQDPK